MISIKSAIIELSQKKSVAGRRYIKWVIHEIHSSPDTYNKNGISWNEQYTLNNLDSAKGMPICVEFMDWEKEEPFGHGMSGVRDGEPIFEYSVVVGVTENAYIDDIEVNGQKIRALIGEGYIFEQRYPNFVNWLKSKLFDGDFPDTSVEICTKKDSGNEVIIYDGGWKEKGRVPMIYDYSGDAILGIEPSDDNAVLLELNNKFHKEDKNTMADNPVIIDLNNKLGEKINEVNSLNAKITALEASISEKEKEISEVNVKLEDTQKESQSKIEEVTSEVNTLKETLSQRDSEVETLTNELNELRQFKDEVIKKDLVAELNSKLSVFSDEEREVVKEKVELFSKEPSKEAIALIVSDVNSFIANKIIEKRKSKQADEQNSKELDVYADVYETNSLEISDSDLY